MIAAVFDCMVFLQAATSDQGPAFACLSLVEAGEVTLSVSGSVLAEVKRLTGATLSRRAGPKRFRKLATPFAVPRRPRV